MSLVLYTQSSQGLFVQGSVCGMMIMSGDSPLGHGRAELILVRKYLTYFLVFSAVNIHIAS